MVIQMRTVGALSFGLLMLVSAVVPGQEPSSAAALVADASRFVREREPQFTSMVGEEHQVQRLVKPSGQTSKQRDLVSDVLIFRAPGARPVVYRDVITQDGKPVRARDERLRKLFTTNWRDAVQQANAIVTESSRLDLDYPRFRAMSGLVLPLVVVAGTPERYRFAKSDDEVTVEETASPTLLRDLATGRNMPLRGRLRIDPSTGALRSASFVVTGPDSEAALDVQYVDDAKLGLFVPVQMHERYRNPLKSKDEHLEVVTDYSNFRRFAVTVETQMDAPQ